MPPDGKASLRKGEAQDGEQRRLSCHRGEVSRPQLGWRSWRGRCQARLWSRRPSPSWVPHPLLVDGVHFVTLVLKKPMTMASWASTWGFRRSPEGDSCCHGSLSPARATTPSTSAPNITPERAWSLHLHRHPSASRTAGLATRRQGPGQGRSGAGRKSSYRVPVTWNRLPRGRREVQMSPGPLPPASSPQDGRSHSGHGIALNQPPWQRGWGRRSPGAGVHVRGGGKGARLRRDVSPGCEPKVDVSSAELSEAAFQQVPRTVLGNRLSINYK